MFLKNSSLEWREALCWFFWRLRLPQSQTGFAIQGKDARREPSAGREGTKGTTSYHQLSHQPWSSLNHRDLSPSMSSPWATDCPPHTPALLYLVTLLLTWWGDTASSEQPRPTGLISPSPWPKAQSCHPYLHTSPTQMPLTAHVTRLWTTDHTRAQ